MVSIPSYTKLVAETQEQAVKTLEAGFELAGRVLELQKKYALGVAGLFTASPAAKS
jgi:hypothetical protein